MMNLQRLVTMVALASLLSTGCYFGRSPGAKRAAKVANGALVGIAALSYLSAVTQPDCPPDADVSCGVGSALQAQAMATVGGLLAIVGVTGLAINYVVPTRRPEAAPLVAPSSSAPDARVVTTPGLPPTRLQR